jgi:hypothetical protein
VGNKNTVRAMKTVKLDNACVEQYSSVGSISTPMEDKTGLHYSFTQRSCLKVAQVLECFTKELMILWYFGILRRSRRVEILLPRLVEKKKLLRVKYGKKYVYFVPRIGRAFSPQIEHALGVAEGLVRFYISDRSAEIIPSRRFDGYGVRPEWGLKYGDKTLLYEFCTADNSRRFNVLRRKIDAYQKFNAIVVFVMDISREEVKEIVIKLKSDGNFMFTDYETFKAVPYGHQLTAPIYIWGGDGKSHHLRPK